MRESNKKVLMIAVALMVVAMLATPLIGTAEACMFRRRKCMFRRITKIEGVTLASDVTQVPAGDPHFIGPDIFLRRGTSNGTVTLTIPGQDPLLGTWYSEWIIRNKWSNFPEPDPEAEGRIIAMVVLTFTGEGTTGTFKGVTYRKIIGMPPSGSSYFEDHMVLYGTGDFKGQTLKLSYEGAPPVIDEGYLIIRK